MQGVLCQEKDPFIPGLKRGDEWEILCKSRLSPLALEVETSRAAPMRAAIFDLDGVLVDSSLYHKKALDQFGVELGVPITDEFHRATFGTRTRETLLRLLPCPPTDAQLDKWVERKEAIFRELARGQLTPLPGAVPLVRALCQAGYRLAIGSSTVRANVALVLDELGLSDAFDVRVAGEDVVAGKPEPDVFLTAAAKLGVPPCRCVVIEDAIQGVEAARRAGMKVIAVATSQRPDALVSADRVILSLEELTPADLDALLADPS